MYSVSVSAANKVLIAENITYINNKGCIAAFENQMLNHGGPGVHHLKLKA